MEAPPPIPPPVPPPAPPPAQPSVPPVPPMPAPERFVPGEVGFLDPFYDGKSADTAQSIEHSGKDTYFWTKPYSLRM